MGGIHNPQERFESKVERIKREKELAKNEIQSGSCTIKPDRICRIDYVDDYGMVITEVAIDMIRRYYEH